ncbi:MAG: hypothetical protein WKF97_13875 [Chitinophagaceae bacterium]
MSTLINEALPQLELPLSGILSYQEKEKAASIIAEAIKQKHEDVGSVPDEHVFRLINELEDGFDCYTYFFFIQDLLLMMLKPENAKELHEKHGSDAPKYFHNLLRFFDFLGQEKKLSAWIDLEKVTNWNSGMDDQAVYILWREYVNPEQKGHMQYWETIKYNSK